MERHYNTHRNAYRNMHPPMFAGVGATMIKGSRIETTGIAESHFGGSYDR
ncbi:MAG: hypothetical protein U9N43_06415 [Euryarchaeota archaeon]|nr:hypothetical protein [Euryarchaeota archaeon]